MSVGGIAAQFTLTKMRERSLGALVNRPCDQLLPVPVSPVISTVDSVGATLATCASVARSAVDAPDNLPEHQRFIDLVAQREVLRSKPFLRLLSILDIGPGPVPPNDVSMFIVDRLIADQEPPILAVVPPESSFHRCGGTLRNGAAERGLHHAEIFGMVDARPNIVGLDEVVERQTQVLQPGAIEVARTSIWTEPTDHVRNEVDELSELALVLAYPLLCLPLIVDVMAGREPSDDRALPVAERQRAIQEPAVLPVGPPRTGLMLERFARRNGRVPGFLDAWAVVRMNRSRPLVDRAWRAGSTPVYSSQRSLRKSVDPSGSALPTIAGIVSMARRRRSSDSCTSA